MVSFVVIKDREFLARSNADFVFGVAADIRVVTPGGEAVLAPGCYALEAERPVEANFFHRFLWEEKYRRGDADAVQMSDGLCVKIGAAAIPAVVMEEGTPAFEIVRPELEAHYGRGDTSKETPPVSLWLPGLKAPPTSGEG
jgi:hypothetical protein